MHSLAKRFLLQSIAMPRKHVARLKKSVQDGHCILPTCNNTKLHARGLCNACYLKYRKRLEMKSQLGPDAALEFETRCIQQGLILPNGEMGEWRTEANNPFASAG